MLPYNISVWAGYFYDLPIEDAIQEFLKEGFQHAEFSVTHLDQA